MTDGANFSHVAGGLLKACDALGVKIETEGKYASDLLNPNQELGFLREQAFESLQKIYLAFVKSIEDSYTDEEVEIYARLLSLETYDKNVSLEDARVQLEQALSQTESASVRFEHYFPHFLKVAMANEPTPKVEEIMEEFFLSLKLMTSTSSIEDNKVCQSLMANIMTQIMQNYVNRAKFRPELVEGSIYLEFNEEGETAESAREKDDFEIIVNPKNGGEFMKKVESYKNLQDPWVDTSPTALEQIMALVGHEEIKTFAEKIVRREKGNVKTLKKRFMAKADTAVNSQLGMSGHHMVLMGNPGTGKTTIANLLGKLFKEAGVLKKGHLVSVSAKDLIAGFVGQTAIKTGEVLKKAKGGVLFIDEAYKLFDGNGTEFASESVAEIILAMENQRNDLVVVFAGYPEPMQRLLKSNEGIPRRIKHYVTCSDYSVPDLMKIRDTLLDVDGHGMDSEAAKLFEEITRQNKEAVESKYWGNGGFVRDYLQNIIQAQEDRLETSGVLENLNPDNKTHQNKIHTILSTLTAEDVKKASVPVPAFLKDGDSSIDNVTRNGAGFIPVRDLKKLAEKHRAEKDKGADVIKLLPAAGNSNRISSRDHRKLRPA